MERYTFFSPMDTRYAGADEAFRERLRPYASEEASVGYLLRIEAALVATFAEIGICPASAAEEVARAAAEVTAAEVYEEEGRIGHDVRSVVNCIRERVSPEAGRFVHLFATSYDIVDTARALRLKEVCRDVVIPELLDLQAVLAKHAHSYASSPQIGRTHGMHAEPVTFGYWLSLYVGRLADRVRALETARHNLRGKFSGAVGARNALALHFPDPAEVERRFLDRLGLRPPEGSVSTQVVPPEATADLAWAAVTAFGVLANLADDLRHLHRTEIAEIRVKKLDERVGSSTMPHKVNPVDFENVKGLWKAYAPRILTVVMDQVTEHQRDLTNSASQRFLPELFVGLAYATLRMTRACKGIELNEEQCRKNLDLSRTETVAEPLYVLLALHGHPSAYDKARELVKEARATGRGVAELAGEQEELRPYLDRFPEDARAVLGDPTLYLGDAPRRTEEACARWEEEAAELRRSLEEERAAG